MWALLGAAGLAAGAEPPVELSQVFKSPQHFSLRAPASWLVLAKGQPVLADPAAQALLAQKPADYLDHFAVAVVDATHRPTPGAFTVRLVPAVLEPNAATAKEMAEILKRNLEVPGTTVSSMGGAVETIGDKRVVHVRGHYEKNGEAYVTAIMAFPGVHDTYLATVTCSSADASHYAGIFSGMFAAMAIDEDFAPEPARADISSGELLTYVSTKHFTIRYPASWIALSQYTHGEVTRAETEFLASRGGGHLDGIDFYAFDPKALNDSASIAVVVLDAVIPASDSSLEHLVQTAVGGFQTRGEPVSEIRPYRGALGGKSAIDVTLVTQINGYPYQERKTMFPGKSRTYYVTTSCQASEVAADVVPLRKMVESLAIDP